MQITRILVPTEFSAHADAALRYALELGRRFEAAVHLLHVVEDAQAAGVRFSEIYTAEIEGLQVNLVRDAETRLRGSVSDDAGTATCEVRRGPAVKQIVEAGREYGSDSIVMGTRGRIGLAPWLVLTLHVQEPGNGVARVA